MTAYQTISVEPATTRRLFVPAGETLGVRDPEGCQPFALTLEDGGGLEVVASDTDAARVGTPLRRRLQVGSERRGASVTLRAGRSQWVEVVNGTGVRMPGRLDTPQTALRVRMPLASPNAQYARSAGAARARAGRASH